MHGGQSRTTKVRNVSFQLSTHDERKQLKLNAWAVATICSPLEPAPIDLAVQQFQESINFDGERYEVALPWIKTNCPKLVNN